MLPEDPVKQEKEQVELAEPVVATPTDDALPSQLTFAQEVRAERLDILWKITLFAAFMLWSAVLLFKRVYIRSSLPAILSSLLAGSINGIGSLFFYASLTRIDASLGQLVNITYLVFVTILLLPQSIKLLFRYRRQAILRILII